MKAQTIAQLNIGDTLVVSLGESRISSHQITHREENMLTLADYDYLGNQSTTHRETLQTLKDDMVDAENNGYTISIERVGSKG